MLIWCLAEDQDIFNIEVGGLPLKARADEVLGALQCSRRIGKFEGHSSSMVQFVVQSKDCFILAIIIASDFPVSG